VAVLSGEEQWVATKAALTVEDGMEAAVAAPEEAEMTEGVTG
jgi:hypothetical protein